MSAKIPRLFKDISFTGLECMEKRAIHTHSNEVRFMLLRAAKGNEADQKAIIELIKSDPSWIGIET